MELVIWHFIFLISSKEEANSTSTCYWKKIFDRKATDCTNYFFKMCPVHSKNKSWIQIQGEHLNDLFKSNINWIYGVH